jgi:hypothetical protein
MFVCKIGRRAVLGMAMGTLLVTAGCALVPSSEPEGGSREAWEAIVSNGAPVRAAVQAVFAVHDHIHQQHIHVHPRLLFQLWVIGIGV